MSRQFLRRQDLIDQVRYRFGSAGVKLRHPVEIMRQLIEDSIQELVQRVGLSDDGAYLDATAVAALPTTAAVTNEVYAEVDWPVNAAAIMGVRCFVAGFNQNRWYPLKKIPWSAIHDFQSQGFLSSLLSQPGPIAYASRSIPSGSETTETVGKVMIVPIPRAGSYRLWYRANHQPQREDNDLFNFQAGWSEWVVLNTCIKMLGPDADARKSYMMWDIERGRQQELLEAGARRLSDGMAMEPRNARNDGYGAGRLDEDT